MKPIDPDQVKAQINFFRAAAIQPAPTTTEAKAMTEAAAVNTKAVSELTSYVKECLDQVAQMEERLDALASRQSATEFYRGSNGNIAVAYSALFLHHAQEYLIEAMKRQEQVEQLAKENTEVEMEYKADREMDANWNERIDDFSDDAMTAE